MFSTLYLANACLTLAGMLSEGTFFFFFKEMITKPYSTKKKQKVCETYSKIQIAGKFDLILFAPL